MEVDSKTITIKWNKQSFTINSSKSNVLELKQELQGLTNVLIIRQKLLLKGKILNDNESVPENSVLTLLGTAESEVIVSTGTKVLFVEDLSKEEKAKLLKDSGEETPVGLTNLGNTCYFNALIQCCGRVEPLREALINFANSGSGNGMNKIFLAELGKVYIALDKGHDTVTPNKLVQALRVLNPSFAEAVQGHYKQQDADECLSLMINLFKELKNESEDKFANNLADELFGINMDITLSNVEIESETRKSNDTSFKLVCYIDSTTSELVDGLKKSLAENIDLFSESLGRNTVFIKKQLISRLPPFLNIQFMRFFWKQAVEDMPDSKAGKAKILKSVMFSKLIDLYDLCSPELQEVLKLGRAIETKMLKDDKNYKTDLSCVTKTDNMIPTGRYQLVAVVTHQGRSSESGHYIGWTHKKDDKWTKYDDDTVTNQKSQDILDLKGGGDWHMAYICIYKALEVPFQEI